MEIIAIVISLASLIVSIRAIRVSKDIAKMQLEYEEKAEKRREEKERLAEQKRNQDKRQEELDWKEAERRAHASPFPIFEGTMKDRIEEEYRTIRSERILRRKV
ncbi:hypothetical protein [Fibrobacter sp. UWB12]|uniref:hypothetical protein n=1 Tax=Fibrobacter sp. UWB12 TaxID=1896203 RepID=UPI0009149695|nr:hypothetical protein [Fibrobacter sp. UWB12]SHK96075.1 hypothetical protein SAMN05720759_11066 [Fibrobacter sp. UWB12]